jgi:hypothetical protein
MPAFTTGSMPAHSCFCPVQLEAKLVISQVGTVKRAIMGWLKRPLSYLLVVEELELGYLG